MKGTATVATEFTRRGHIGLKKAPFPVTIDPDNAPHVSATKTYIAPHKSLERGIYRISYPLEELDIGNYSVEARHHLFLQVYKDDRGKMRSIVFEVDGHGYNGGSHADTTLDYKINMDAPGVVIAPIVTESDVKELGGTWTDPAVDKLKTTIENVSQELKPIPYHLLKNNCKTAATRATNDALSLLTFDNNSEMKEAMNKLAQTRMNYPLNKNASIPKVIYQVFATPSKHSLGEKIKYVGKFLSGFFGLEAAEKILRPVGEAVERMSWKSRPTESGLLNESSAAGDIPGSHENTKKSRYVVGPTHASAIASSEIKLGPENVTEEASVNNVRALMTAKEHNAHRTTYGKMYSIGEEI